MGRELHHINCDGAVGALEAQLVVNETRGVSTGHERGLSKAVFLNVKDAAIGIAGQCGNTPVLLVC